MDLLDWGRNLMKSFKNRLADCRKDMQVLLACDDLDNIKHLSEVIMKFLTILHQYEDF